MRRLLAGLRRLLEGAYWGDMLCGAPRPPMPGAAVCPYCDRPARMHATLADCVNEDTRNEMDTPHGDEE